MGEWTPKHPVVPVSETDPISTPGPWQPKHPLVAVPSDAAPAAPVPEQPSSGEALGRGFIQGATLGFGDEIGAGAKAVADSTLGKYAPGLVEGLQKWAAEHPNLARATQLDLANTITTRSTKSLGDDYAEARDRSRADNDAAEAAHPRMYLAGNLAGGVATAPLMPSLGAAKGAGLGTRLGLEALNAAGQGVVNGVGSSRAQDVGGEALDGLIGGATGAVLAPVAHGVGVGTGKIVNWATAPISRQLDRLGNSEAVNAVLPMLKGYRKIAGSGNVEDEVQKMGAGLRRADAVRFGDNVGNINDRLQPMQEAAGKKIGAVIDELDAARPLSPYNNAHGLHVPSAESLTAGPEMGLRSETMEQFARSPFGAPNPGGTAAMPPAPTASPHLTPDEVNTEQLTKALRARYGDGVPPTGPAASYPRADHAAQMRETPIPRTEEVRSPPIRNRSLLTRKAIADRIDNEVAGPLAGMHGERDVTAQLGKESAELRKYADAPGGNNAMTFREAEGLKRSYDRAFDPTKPNDVQTGMKHVYGVVKDQTEREADRVSPELGKKFRDAKQAYADVAPAEMFAADAAARKMANRKLSPSDYAAALGEWQKDGALKGGVMALAHNQLRTRGAASTAAAAWGLADALRANPEKFGRFAGYLTRAAQKGPEQLAFVHSMLMEREPEYRQQIESMDEEP